MKEACREELQEEGWIALTLDQMKILHIMGIPGMGKLNLNIANLVKNDVLHRQG